jgi:integrase
VELLQAAFWQGKARSSQSERSWARLRTELNRLPAEATLTTDLLVAVVRQLPEGSRTRLEACKTYKRMGKLAGLQGLEVLDAVRTPYESQERDIPSDEKLLELLEQARPHPRWGWCTAALVVYGCRPSEVFSLTPDSNGTAQCLTLKRKQQGGRSGLPVWRTALALPPAWVKRFDLLDISRPWEFTSPREYDSNEAKRLTEQWGKWVGRRMPRLNLYDFRHAWAIRSVYAVPNASMAAKCMGHSLEVHHREYHRWLDQSDVAQFAVSIA